MKRLLTPALLSALLMPVAVVGPVGGDAVHADAASCVEPVAERSYTDSTIVYRLAIDLTACNWWDGSSIQLVGSLERVDGQAGQGAWSAAICGAPGHRTAEEPTAESAGDEAPASPRRRSGDCEVAVDLEHPADEVAHYHGEITYPWETTRRTLSFTALCGSAGCVDLPAGTTTGALATLADLYDTLTGGHDDAE